ncbi:MAG TPA: methyltransferase domain-containing protein [Nakamurella sp.]
MTATFDPTRYKDTTRQQWQDAAAAWHRWGPTIESWLGEATARMMEAAGIRAGHSVLDVAAGAGGQTLVAAERVGPTGRVLATDIAPAILANAASAAAAAGLRNVRIAEMDGEGISVPPASFDAVISRVGLIYFPDRHAALTGMYRALRPGGRLSAVVYSTPERNEFFAVPIGVIRRRAQLPPAAPGQPGPFSLGSPGVAETALRAAGFHDIQVAHVPSPLRMAAATDYVRFARESFGALHQMLAGLGEPDRAAAWDEIGRELARFDGPDGFVGPCEMLVVSGRKPVSTP